MRLFHRFFLTRRKRDYSCRLSAHPPLCWVSTVLSSFGDLLLKLLNSSFRMQFTALASTYKTSSFFYLRALVRKSRDLRTGISQQSKACRSSYSACISYKSLLARAKETQLISEEDSASPDLMQHKPAETAEHKVAMNQPQSPGTQWVWGHRTAAVWGLQVEYTKRRTEHQLALDPLIAVRNPTAHSSTLQLAV